MVFLETASVTLGKLPGNKREFFQTVLLPLNRDWPACVCFRRTQRTSRNRQRPRPSRQTVKRTKLCDSVIATFIQQDCLFYIHYRIHLSSELCLGNITAQVHGRPKTNSPGSANRTCFICFKYLTFTSPNKTSPTVLRLGYIV